MKEERRRVDVANKREELLKVCVRKREREQNCFLVTVNKQNDREFDDKHPTCNVKKTNKN